MKNIFFLIVASLLGFFGNALSRENCGPGPIESGFGANGPFRVLRDTIISPELDKKVSIFRPDTTAGRFPLIIICHRFGSDSPDGYLELIEHIVSRGNVLIYLPARKVSFTRNQVIKYDVGLSDVEKTVQYFKAIVDTSRIGIIGHGFGGGAVPALTRKLVLEKHWGKRGAFMYIMSPWYLYSLDERSMRAFPAGVKCVIQVFDDDRYNDPRIAGDMFEILGIAPENKQFLMLFGDNNENCRLDCDNTTPQGNLSDFGEENALDYYGIYRVFDALESASFNSDTAATNFIFGNRKPHELSMGKWPDGKALHPMIATRTPSTILRRGIFVNQWKSPRNPRINVSRFRLARKIFFNNKGKMAKQLGQYAVRSIGDRYKENDFDTIVNPIQKGYGSEGINPVAVERCLSPLNSKDSVSFYYPANVKGPVPTIFFVHGYNGDSPDNFRELINHIVSRGYALVFSPYPTFPSVKEEKIVLEKYEIVFAGFEQAVSQFGDKIDTTRIGFMGQSFGGGAVPSLSWRALTQKHWGTNAAFLFITAPWYCFNISQQQLKEFPQNVNMVMMVFDDDAINDHAMATDIFKSIGIPSANKNYLTIYSDSLGDYVMPANHFLPYGVGNINGVMDMLDFYGIFRHFDALAAYSFTGASDAKNIALGNGSAEQCYMGEWPDKRAIRPITWSVDPKPLHRELSYLFAWDNKLNPRKNLLEP